MNHFDRFIATFFVLGLMVSSVAFAAFLASDELSRSSLTALTPRPAKWEVLPRHEARLVEMPAPEVDVNTYTFRVRR